MLSKTTWMGLIALAALVPVGLRVAIKIYNRPTPVDPAMAKAGEELFNHQWTKNDPLTVSGNGPGPVANANSCVFCHEQGRVGGGGDLPQNVTTFAVRSGPNMENTREGVVHKLGGEMLSHVHPGLPAIPASKLSLDELPRTAPTVALTGMTAPAGAQPVKLMFLPRGVRISQLNTPALFGTKQIDDLPESAILANAKAQRIRYAMAPPGGTEYPVGRATRTASGKLGKFGWKAQTATLGAFVRAACANELGLGNPAQAQPTPLFDPSYTPTGLDLTDQQCDQLTAYVASLGQPVEKVPDTAAGIEQAERGKKLFSSVGCAECHVADVGNVKGIYSDLLLHHMGADLEGGGSYYDHPLPPIPGPPDDDPDPEGPAKSAEWRTPPLWGVADSAPYMHDGRAPTLEDAVATHQGQGAASATRFSKLSQVERNQVVAFLKTLRAPAP
jgi:CxxC motif-containing protein (DUF1111 family)